MMDIPAGQRMMVVHRGSVGLAPIFLVPQLCLLYPLPHATCQIAQCAPPPHFAIRIPRSKDASE